MSNTTFAARADTPPVEDFSYSQVPPLAPISLAFGVCAASSLVTPLGGLFGLIGVICGLLAWRKIAVSEGAFGGALLAKAGTAASFSFASLGIGWGAYAYATEVPDGFRRISFKYDVSAKGFANNEGYRAIHPEVQALDGKQVFIKGYIYPERQMFDLPGFIFCLDAGDCCFGGDPALTDMIDVKFVNDVRPDYSDSRVAVAGTFKINPAGGNGTLDPVYSIEATHFSKSGIF